MKGTTIAIGGFLFQQLPAKIWGWNGKCDKCNYCLLPKFVEGFKKTKTAECMALHCHIKQNKNMVWRKIKMPMTMDDIKKCEKRRNEKSYDTEGHRRCEAWRGRN